MSFQELPQDSTSVVNHELKVDGVLRLRVIDASVMPYVVSWNTNAPTIMIAEKGRDLTLSVTASKDTFDWLVEWDESMYVYVPYFILISIKY